MWNEIILQNEPEAEDGAVNQSFSITDRVILEALEIMLFAWIRQIAQTTFVPHTTGFRGLAKLLHFVLKRLRWVPH
jgi:hypothetical protein